jgi:N-acetylglucosaminyldiphosphoundecaprenol N-acetyl-beta-D-mannosaminyltransferase
MTAGLRVQQPGRYTLDLSRDVHALLGLVFDATTLQGACRHLLGAVDRREPCFLSTPNTNFAMAGLNDHAFRGSVRRSDYSVADGEPLTALARWMSIPLTERVAGADVFAALREQRADRQPLRVYFFGGPPGASAAACEVLNAEHRGMVAVGSDEGGFGDVAAMSTAAVRERITQAQPQLISVALGAKKGQAWIELNRAHLPPAVVSHLGAVVNFVAGRVQRAPMVWQRLGLEWIWRIVQEPALWRRYFDDGRALVDHVVQRILPWLLRRRRLNPQLASAPATLARTVAASAVVYELQGAWVASALPALRLQLAQDLQAGQRVMLRIAGVSHVDSAFLGLVAITQAWQGGALIEDGPQCQPWVRQTFVAHGVEDLLAHTSV